MSEKPLSKAQSEEQTLLELGFGYAIQKLEQHNAQVPEGLIEKYVINMFLSQLPEVRQQLCWIKDGLEFEIKVERFRKNLNAADRLLHESKSIIIAYRQAGQLEPVWPEELNWKD